MSNPIFQALGGRPQNDGGFGQMMRNFHSFRNSFRGDARAEVQRLLDSGKMTQDQFNQLGQIANQILGAK